MSISSYFNPRSYKRSDSIIAFTVFTHFISIHAPTRGATVAYVKNISNYLISIHAPTRGATGYFYCLTTSVKISIHAPTRGATE